MQTKNTQKVILITGASRGIGAACAIKAAQLGFAVCVNYKNQAQAAQDVVSRIVADGGRALAVRADVSSEQEVSEMFEIARDQLGPITALVNNAGILDKQMRLETMSIDRIKRILETNVIGTILCVQQAIKHMAYKHGGGGGAIVNVSSVAARLGAPREYIDYAASKGAVDSMTIGLAKELAVDGIRVNAVRPGYIYTDMHASGGEPNRVDRVKDLVPLKRGGSAEEVANAILWLVSDEASYATGTFIDVAGGN